MNEKVSVVIPVYNSEDTIKRCVTSLVEGTHKNLEIILVEDGSMDKSLEICKYLAEKYEQVICVPNDSNHGVSYTRNHGLEVMSGKYLMFVDSDDWVEPNYVETLLKVCINHKHTIPVCGYMNHDESKNKRSDVFTWSDKSDIELESIESTMSLLYEKRLLQIIWNKVFLVDVIIENKIRFDETIFVGEDFRFLLNYMKCGKIQQFAFINRTLYHYSRDNEDSLATKFLEIGIEEPMKNFKLMYQLMEKSDEEIRRLLDVEYEKQLNQYAYHIMHDDRFSRKEKKEKINLLSPKLGNQLYQKNKKILVKERLMRVKQRIV